MVLMSSIHFRRVLPPHNCIVLSFLPFHYSPKSKTDFFFFLLLLLQYPRLFSLTRRRILNSSIPEESKTFKFPKALNHPLQTSSRKSLFTLASCIPSLARRSSRGGGGSIVQFHCCYPTTFGWINDSNINKTWFRIFLLCWLLVPLTLGNNARKEIGTDCKLFFARRTYADPSSE